MTFARDCIPAGYWVKPEEPGQVRQHLKAVSIAVGVWAGAVGFGATHWYFAAPAPGTWEDRSSPLPQSYR